MSAQRLTPDLRTLFLAIARTSVASSCVIGCADEHSYVADDDEPDAAFSETDTGEHPKDAGTPHDTGAPGEASIAPQDAGIDTGADAAPKDSGPAEPDGGGWALISCSEPDAALKTTRPTDYLGVYSDHQYQGIAPTMLPDGGLSVQRGLGEFAHVGGACSGVTNMASCEQQLLQLKGNRSACLVQDCRFAVTRSADMLLRIDSRVALVELLGSIDSAAEAILLATFDQRPLCAGLKVDARDIGTEIRAAVGGGYELRTTWEGCGQGLYQDFVTITAEGTLTVASHTMLSTGSNCAIGRRPSGLCASEAAASATRVGAFLAQAAQLEAASIYAFYQLIGELRAHGAPEELQLLALDAMLDEVRHARDVGQLARDHGAAMRVPEVKPSVLRSLFELALHNAHEGCVRETFGALVATYQAETAEDLRVRALMAAIAEDETRHAALSWKLMAWLTPRLSEREQAQVAAERQRAYALLQNELDAGLSEAECRLLGFPTRAVSAALLTRMEQAFA